MYGFGVTVDGWLIVKAKCIKSWISEGLAGALWLESNFQLFCLYMECGIFFVSYLDGEREEWLIEEYLSFVEDDKFSVK